jgi:hypothetical protein
VPKPKNLQELDIVLREEISNWVLVKEECSREEGDMRQEEDSSKSEECCRILLKEARRVIFKAAPHGDKTNLLSNLWRWSLYTSKSIHKSHK